MKTPPDGFWVFSTERDGFSKDQVCELLARLHQEMTELVLENNQLKEQINAVDRVTSQFGTINP